jgi:hypothetical protein
MTRARRGPGFAGAILVLAWLLAGAPAGAQAPPAPPDAVFTVEVDPAGWSARGPSVSGYVYNRSLNRAGDVRLRVEVLDGDGHVIATADGWMYGAVAPGGRTYFVVRIPRRGAAYRVTVLSFSWLALGGP